jgi:hypothetical protein
MAVAGLGEYQRSLLATRTRALRRTARTVETMMGLLNDAASDIMATLSITDKIATNPVTRRLMAGKLAAIQDRLTVLGEEYNGIVSGAVEETIDDVVTVRRSATARLGQANRAAIDASFLTVPEAALRLYAQRIDVEGLKLSGKLWAQSQMATIQRTVGASMARGESAGKLARKLEAFLLPEARGGAKRVVHLGDTPVSHKATRLAITEINNGYWETGAVSAFASPVVEAQLWQLSGRHPRTDECDILAWADGYRLGPGVYPAGDLPSKPHPHCLCYAIDVLRDVADWGKSKRDHGAPDLTRIDSRALADAPAAVRARVGETFAPAELRAAVADLSPSERGHLTPRYVDRVNRQYTDLTRAGRETQIGAAQEDAA